MMGKLIMRLLHARTVTHVMHLKTRSYATHVALAGFYDGIVPLADSLAEAYQGEYNLITDYSYPFKMAEDPLEFLADLSGWIEDNRSECCDEDDTYMQNIIDEIIALIRSTQYKLKFLK